MKEYVDLECNKERLDLTCKQLERVVIKSDNLKWLYLYNNNLKEITLECPNLRGLDLHNNNLEEISLDYPTLKWLRLNNNNLKEITLECPNLEWLDLEDNNLKEITLECPNLKDLWLANNPHTIMKISLTDCLKKQEAEEHLEDFFKYIHSPSEEEILVFKVITGYECPWAYALTRRYY